MGASRTFFGHTVGQTGACQAEWIFGLLEVPGFLAEFWKPETCLGGPGPNNNLREYQYFPSVNMKDNLTPSTLKNIFVHESNWNSFQSGKAFSSGYYKGHGADDNLLIEDSAELISGYVWRGQSFFEFGRVFSRSAIVSRLTRGALLSSANQIMI